MAMQETSARCCGVIIEKKKKKQFHIKKQPYIHRVTNQKNY